MIKFIWQPVLPILSLWLLTLSLLLIKSRHIILIYPLASLYYLPNLISYVIQPWHATTLTFLLTQSSYTLSAITLAIGSFTFLIEFLEHICLQRKKYKAELPLNY